MWMLLGLMLLVLQADSLPQVGMLPPHPGVQPAEVLT